MVELLSRDQMAASDWSRYSHVKLCGTTTLPATAAEDVDNNSDDVDNSNNSTDAGNSTETGSKPSRPATSALIMPAIQGASKTNP